MFVDRNNAVANSRCYLENYARVHIPLLSGYAFTNIIYTSLNVDLIKTWLVYQYKLQNIVNLLSNVQDIRSTMTLFDKYLTIVKH